MIGNQSIAPLDNEITGLGLQPLAVVSLQGIFEFNRLVINANTDGDVSGNASVSAATRIDCA